MVKPQTCTSPVALVHSRLTGGFALGGLAHASTKALPSGHADLSHQAE